MKYELIYHYSDENELEHYGRKGMKWGQHIFGVDPRTHEESKEKRMLLRRTRASEINLKREGKRTDVARKMATKENERYSTSLQKYSRAILPWTKNKRYDALTKAAESRQLAQKELQKTELDRKKAQKMYEDYSNALKNHTSRMISKYGSDQIRSLKEKDMKVGKDLVQRVIKTGLTVNEVPFVGSWFTREITNDWRMGDSDEIRSDKLKKLVNTSY